MSLSGYYHEVIGFMERNMFSCPSKTHLGIECPGCGLQRSLLLLMKGEFYESLRIYPATIPLLFMFIFLLLHVKFKFSKGALILQYIFIFNAALVFISYIIKRL